MNDNYEMIRFKTAHQTDTVDVIKTGKYNHMVNI